MLLCDGCDCGECFPFRHQKERAITLRLGFHTFCLTPALSTIPKGQWFCHTCLFGTGGDFGFDEGEDHSLSTFQARDLAFRKMWFQSHPPPQPGNALSSADANDPTVTVWGNVRVTEDDVEEDVPASMPSSKSAGSSWIAIRMSEYTSWYDGIS